MSKYRGKLVYMGMGRTGVITGYSYDETETDIDETWFIRPVGCSRDEIEETSKKPTILDAVKFVTVGKTLFVEVSAKGQSYPGYAIISPNDEKVAWIGRCLAVARAMGDAAAIDTLLKITNYDAAEEVEAEEVEDIEEDEEVEDIEEDEVEKDADEDLDDEDADEEENA